MAPHCPGARSYQGTAVQCSLPVYHSGSHYGREYGIAGLFQLYWAEDSTCSGVVELKSRGLPYIICCSSIEGHECIHNFASTLVDHG